MKEIEKFRRFASSVQIAHHIPGRVRFKLGKLQLDDEDRDVLEEARKFQKVLDSIKGVKDIRLNLLARSCTVEYDTAVIPPAAWSDVLGGVDSPAANVLLGILEKKYEEAKDA
jgi:copper chaperone CopZ